MYTEDTAGPGFWKSEVLVLLGVWLIAARFVLPQPMVVYNLWFVGFITTNAAIMMAGNRKWERPLAGAAAIWLFISGFVPSVQQGTALTLNELGVALVFIVAGLSAFVHLRDDVRHARPLTM